MSAFYFRQIFAKFAPKIRLSRKIAHFSEVMASNDLKRKSSDSSASAPVKKPAGHWSMGLKASMEDPELKVDSDDQVVIIKDKYPKARHHFLILPLKNIPSLKAMSKDDLELLEYMERRGETLTRDTDPDTDWRLGYHAIPSMSQVHLHVISQDFDSSCLKTKKHWNSFTTEYFIDSKDVIKMVKKEGKFEVNTSKYGEMLKRPLKCHVCKKEMKNMPTLKAHVVLHYPKQSSKAK